MIKIKTDRKRRDSAGMPLSLTIIERNKVKKVKLKTNPTTTPSGLLFPVVSTEEDNIIGKTGNMQGERIVTIPARNANAASKIIAYLIFANNSSICPPFHLAISFPELSIWTNVCW